MGSLSEYIRDKINVFNARERITAGRSTESTLDAIELDSL